MAPLAAATGKHPAVDLIGRLKVLFSGKSVSAILIGGEAIVQAILDESVDGDPMLSSIISRHVHVPGLDAAGVQEFLEKRGKNPTGQTVAETLLQTRGRYKPLLRWLADGEPASAQLPESRQRLQRLLASWGKPTPLERVSWPAYSLEGVVQHILAHCDVLGSNAGIVEDQCRSIVLSAAISLRRRLGDEEERRTIQEVAAALRPLTGDVKMATEVAERVRHLVHPDSVPSSKPNPSGTGDPTKTG
jgi:hypothetical protein